MRTTQKQILDIFKQLDTTLCVIVFQENGIRGTMIVGLDLLEAISKISFYLSKGQRCILLDEKGAKEVDKIEGKIILIEEDSRRFHLITYEKCLPFALNLNNK